MANSPSCSKTPTKTSPSTSPKTVRVFHVFDADDFREHFSAFDNSGKLFFLAPTEAARVPHGKFELQKSYKVRGFEEEGPKVIIGRASTISIFPMEFPANKLSEDLRSRASKALRVHDIVSIAKAKSQETPLEQSISVKGKVIRFAATSQQNARTTGKPLTLRSACIANTTASMCITLFGPQVNKVEKGNTYFFKNVQKGSFGGSNLLKVLSFASKIVPTEDIKGEKTNDISDDEEELADKKLPITRTITGIQAGSIRWYKACTHPSGCTKKIESCSHKLPGINNAIVDFDMHYVKDGETHDKEVKVFTKELLQLLSKDDFEELETPEALEELIKSNLPMSVTFQGYKTNNGAFAMSHPTDIITKIELANIDFD